jgi:hypothetical protein
MRVSSLRWLSTSKQRERLIDLSRVWMQAALEQERKFALTVPNYIQPRPVIVPWSSLYRARLDA